MSHALRPTEAATWQGRTDAGEAGDASRWHQRVRPWSPGTAPGVALLGFACDIGVRRNGGRPGAAAGPGAIRRALANLAWHQSLGVCDAGDVHAEGDDLEGAQALFAETAATLLGAGHRVLALGGGHEIARASHLAIVRSVPPGTTIGIVNIDAHFDLRAGAPGNSGTPFRQIAEQCAAAGRAFRYLCLGVSEDANTRALFDTARRLGAQWRLDTDMSCDRHDEAHAQLAQFVRGVDRVHLSIDLDVLPASVAPGVSAPASLGVAPELVESLALAAAASGKLAIADIAELNPGHDIDGRTARVAARLAARLAR